MLAPDLADPELDRLSRRFTRIVLAILILGLAATATVALVVDPFEVFGTGRIPTSIVNDREVKPARFLAAQPAPQALILGSSRVWKLRPACVTELTGLPAFNFGAALAAAEDFDAIVKFARARGRAPLRLLVIDVEVDSFNFFNSHQLELSSYLGPFSADPGLSWGEATKGLFGFQSFQHGLRVAWAHVRGRPEAPDYVVEPDGFRVEPARDAKIARGTFDWDGALAGELQTFKRHATDPFDRLDPARVAQFERMVREAHAQGIAIEAFVAPMHPAIAEARSYSQVRARTADLDRVVARLEAEGLLRYHRLEEFAGIDTAPHAYYDGVHMTEETSTKLLLRMFRREHGCGR